MTKKQPPVAADPSARKGRTSVVVNTKKAPPSAASARGHASRLRTLDYSAGRCIKLKLGHFSSSQVACNKDKDGRLIPFKVVDELMRLRPMRKHASLEFWGKIIKEHNLHGGFASDLLLPAEEEVVNKELNLILRHVTARIRPRNLRGSFCDG